MINIAIPGTPRRLFTYILPNHLARELSPGQRCIVPFGRRKVIGYYIESADRKPDVPLKAVSAIPDRNSLFNEELFEFLKWMAEYYLANPADVLNAAIPPGLRKIKKPAYQPTKNLDTILHRRQVPEPLMKKLAEKGRLSPRDVSLFEKTCPGLIEELVHTGDLKPNWVGAEGIRDEILIGYRINDAEADDDETIKGIISAGPESRLFRKGDILSKGITGYRFDKLLKQNVIIPVYGLPDLFDYVRPRPDVNAIVPNREQTEAIKAITQKFNRFTPFLLYGITGSGKTLVYCHTARKVLENGQTVLVLVPEIALAGTLLSYFKSFFQDKIALLHSALRSRERVLVWQNIKNGKYKIVIGARSAIFAPLENIGLIIADEEHDESYKQDDPSPRFQARDAAVMRAKMAGIPVVMGSASPSVESFHNALSGRYELLKLTRRPEKADIPIVRLVDLRKKMPVKGDHFFTKTLKSKINESLKAGHQVILYLNRRGFSPRIKCTDCGHTPLCPHCDISLTFHRAGNRLMCHFCGYVDSNYNICAGCGGESFIYLGIGTQKIEDKITDLFGDAKMIRLDSDSAAGRVKAHLILSDFASGKYNILLGTQMVTKGIDFPAVSLVGVLMADIGLDMPDFRASEKLFAKLIQVAGRSGRGIVPGEVVIQTFNPELELIDDAARQDYDTYYEREILSRQKLQYPPFSHLINFRFSGKKEDTVRKHSHDFKKRLEEKLKDFGLRVQILGPAPCPLYRLRGLHRRHLFVKTKRILKFIKFLDSWEHDEPKFSLPSKVRLVIDVDPYDMM